MPPAKLPADLPVIIHALLKPRWKWLPKLGRIATKTREVLARENLPRDTEISYLVERLQQFASADLSTPEKIMVRWVQIKLPSHANVDAALREIASWTCVEKAYVVPPPSLPRSMGLPSA